MGNGEFISKCKDIVMFYASGYNGSTLTTDDIYVVWICKTLQNNKALLSTTREDGLYYEITYNGDKKEFYFDVYKKQNNIRIGENDLWEK